MSTTPTTPTSAQDATPKTVTFEWHGKPVTLPTPQKRQRNPKKPSWFLSVIKPLSYSKKYDQYLLDYDKVRMENYAYDLVKYPDDRFNPKKVLGLVLTGAAVIGGGAAAISAFSNHTEDNTPALIESPDSTVE